MNLVDIHLRKQVENRYAGNNQDEPHDGSQIRHLEKRGAGSLCGNGEDEEYVVERRENIQIVFLYCEKSGERNPCRVLKSSVTTFCSSLRVSCV